LTCTPNDGTYLFTLAQSRMGQDQSIQTKEGTCMAEAEQSDVMSLTVALLSAYFANNTVPSSELPALVEGTRKALLGDAPVVSPAPEETVSAPVSVEPAAVPPTPAPEFKPAVTVDASLASPDQILSLIDGKPYKSLKRHLSTHGLTPAEYRARYDLPADYPMVAPGYSAARREAALKLGLGGKRKDVAANPAPVRKARVNASAPATKAKPNAVAGKGKPSAVAETVAAPAGEPAPTPEATASEAAQVKATPARGPRAKAAPAKASPKTSNAKAAIGKGKPAAAVEPAKPKRSRATKADTPPTAPVEIAPAETASAE
jgi:predicted transcriptional regulator